MTETSHPQKRDAKEIMEKYKARAVIIITFTGDREHLWMASYAEKKAECDAFGRVGDKAYKAAMNAFLEERDVNHAL